MVDEREIQYRMRFYRQEVLRERNHDRLQRKASKEHHPFFALRFKLPRLWRREKKERPNQAIPARRSAEGGAS